MKHREAWWICLRPEQPTRSLLRPFGLRTRLETASCIIPDSIRSENKATSIFKVNAAKHEVSGISRETQWPRGHVQLSSIKDPVQLFATVDKGSDVQARSVSKPGHISSVRKASTGVPLSKRLTYLLKCKEELLWLEQGLIEWPARILPFQIDGICALMDQSFLLLADDMGLGKTIQMIAAMRIEAIRGRIRAALIIAPASLLNQWRRELSKWAPELRVAMVRGPSAERNWLWRVPAHVYLVSFETFRFDFNDHPRSPIGRKVWDIVVLDEAQKIKNPDVEISRKCKRIPRKRAVAMTGTPLENHIGDLSSILEFLQPHERGDEPRRLKTGQALMDLHQRIQLRRKKTDVLPQLPPKIITDLILPLQPGQRQTYERAETEGVLQLRRNVTIPIVSVLELIMRLKQICNMCPSTGESAKLIDVGNRLEMLRSQGHRALIFSQFVDEQYGCKAICDALSDYNPLLFTGGMSQRQKDDVVRLFKENSNYGVLVLSLRSGGVGLNLQDASYVFHFDRWWNPAVENQAEDRSHRMGQTVPVHVYRYVSERTIEERIDEILQRKRALFESTIDGVSLNIESMLSYRELLGLFGLE